MSRKPAHLELVGGKGPRQRVWDAIRRLATSGATFTESDIWDATESAETDIETGMIRDYRRCLVNAGILAVASQSGRYVEVTYTLARDAGVEAPRVKRDGSPVTQGLAQEQMWRTLRMLKGDTNARELAAHASTPEIPVAVTAAADYLGNLQRASYLRITRAHQPGQKGLTRYQLVTNTGPRPPMVCRTDAIYDPNLGKTVWVRPVTEEVAIYGT